MCFDLSFEGGKSRFVKIFDKMKFQFGTDFFGEFFGIFPVFFGHHDRCDTGTEGGDHLFTDTADGGDIAQRVKEMNAALHGRGGGRNGFAQGSVEATQAEIEAFFKG